MRKLYYIDASMCGGDNLPEDFDLEEFCEVLQSKVPRDVEIVAITESGTCPINPDPWLVNEDLFREALGKYLHR